MKIEKMETLGDKELDMIVLAISVAKCSKYINQEQYNCMSSLKFRVENEIKHRRYLYEKHSNK